MLTLELNIELDKPQDKMLNGEAYGVSYCLHLNDEGGDPRRYCPFLTWTPGPDLVGTWSCAIARHLRWSPGGELTTETLIHPVTYAELRVPTRMCEARVARSEASKPQQPQPPTSTAQAPSSHAPMTAAQASTGPMRRRPLPPKLLQPA